MINLTPAGFRIIKNCALTSNVLSVFLGISQIGDILQRIPEHVEQEYRDAAQHGYSRYSTGTKDAVKVLYGYYTYITGTPGRDGIILDPRSVQVLQLQYSTTDTVLVVKIQLKYN